MEIPGFVKIASIAGDGPVWVRPELVKVTRKPRPRVEKGSVINVARALNSPFRIFHSQRKGTLRLGVNTN